MNKRIHTCHIELNLCNKDYAQCLIFVPISIWTFECLKPLSSSLILTICIHIVFKIRIYYIFTFYICISMRPREQMELCSDICMGSNLNFKLPNIIHVLWTVCVCVCVCGYNSKMFPIFPIRKMEMHRWPKTWITIQCSLLNTYERNMKLHFT